MLGSQMLSGGTGVQKCEEQSKCMHCSACLGAGMSVMRSCSYCVQQLQVVATYHGDHAYCFDVTGASSSAGSIQQTGGQPLNLFAQPAASAALAAGALSHGLTIGGRLRNGSSPVAGASSSSANGYSGGSSSGSGGSMADLPGMLPAAAERAKADGNLALFSKQASCCRAFGGSTALG